MDWIFAGIFFFRRASFLLFFPIIIFLQYKYGWSHDIPILRRTGQISGHGVTISFQLLISYRFRQTKLQNQNTLQNIGSDHMTGRETFKDPLVRVRVSRVRFPKICPVCGEEATETNQVICTPRKTQFLSQGPSAPYERRRMGIPLPEVKTFHVYVCEDHALDDGGILRLRAASSFYALLALCMLVFAIMVIGNDIRLGRALTLWTGLFFMFVAASMILAIFAFRPFGLEAAFRIIGFDYDLRHVWLQLENPLYRETLYNLNAMDAQLVSWIEKG